LKTGDRRIPSEEVSSSALPSGFSRHPLVPGLFSSRARVISLADGPTRPNQRLPVRGPVPTFPQLEPPLLFPDRSGTQGPVSVSRTRCLLPESSRPVGGIPPELRDPTAGDRQPILQRRARRGYAGDRRLTTASAQARRAKDHSPAIHGWGTGTRNRTSPVSDERTYSAREPLS